MGTKKETQPRYMEVNVPQEAITEVAELIESNEIEANILGTGDEQETISIGFNYLPEQRESMLEILEVVEDFKEESEEEQEEEETED